VVEEFKSDGMLALPFIYPPYEALFQSINVISTNETRLLLSDFHIFAAPWLAAAELAGKEGKVRRAESEKG